MRALAEVTVGARVGAFVPQLVSRAGALVSVLHAETELCAFLERDHPVRAHWKQRCGVCVSWAQLGLSSDQVSWVWCWLVAGRCLSRKAGLGRSSQLQQCPSGCIQRKWVLVEIPSHDSVRMMKRHSSPGKLLPSPPFMSDLSKEAERRLHRVQLVAHCSMDCLVCHTQQVFHRTALQSRQRASCSAVDMDDQHSCGGKGDRGALADRSHGSQTQAGASDGQLLQPADVQALPSSRDYIAWQKKAGTMLLPCDFSLVDTFCRVPVQKETGIKAVEDCSCSAVGDVK